MQGKVRVKSPANEKLVCASSHYKTTLKENCPRESQEAPESFLCWHLWHLFCCFPLSAELVIYLLLIVVCMMTGFLDSYQNCEFALHFIQPVFLLFPH